jgi:uncharacterized protein YcbK (DUF882 family)
MRLRFNGWVATVVGAAMVLALGGTAKAGDRTETLHPQNESRQYSLHLHQLHTDESIDVVYRVGDTYIPAALNKLNYFLRDYRTGAVKAYDPKEFDLLHSLMSKLGRPNGVIDIVCGYRTPWTNHFLRTRSAHTGVAEHSQHMQAKAIDIRVPGVSTVKLRNTALSLHEGGVGYYPVSQFVHVDVGPVREWSFGRVRSRHRHSRARVRALGE